MNSLHYFERKKIKEAQEENITDAIQLMLASIYEEAHEKKKMETEVSV